MRDRDQVFQAAAVFLSATIQGGKGIGLHESPVIVGQCVDLAEQLVAEIDRRELAAEIAEGLERAAKANAKREAPPLVVDLAAFGARPEVASTDLVASAGAAFEALKAAAPVGEPAKAPLPEPTEGA